MCTSQRHSSLVLIRLRFCWDVSSLAKISLQKPRKKKQKTRWRCHTQPHFKLHRMMSAVAFTDSWGKRTFVCVCGVVSGWLSGWSCETRCDPWHELWVYLWRPFISTCDSVRMEPGQGKDKEEDKHQHRQRQADRQGGKRCLWRSWTVSAERGCKRIFFEGWGGG